MLRSGSRVGATGVRDGSDGLDPLVLQPVELPLSVLDNAYPGPREQLLSRAAVQPDLEGDLRRLPRGRSGRIPGEVYVVEVVDLLLLRPLLRGTDLPLQALGEVRPRCLGGLERLLHIHVEDRLLGLTQGQSGLLRRLPDEGVTGGSVPVARVLGPSGRGRIGRLPLRFGDTLDRPSRLLPGVWAEQRPAARTEDEQQKEGDHRGGQRPARPRPGPEGPRREADRAFGRPRELGRSPPKTSRDGLDAGGAHGFGGPPQPRGSGSPDGGGGCRGGRLAHVEQPLVHGGGIRTVRGFLGEAPEDEGLEALADERTSRPRRYGRLRELLAGDLQRVSGKGRPPHRRVVEGRAERVDVALGCDLLALQLLWRGVGRCPEVRVRAGGAGRRVQGAGDAEIGKLRAPVLVYEHVLRLDVAVDDAPFVGVGEPVREGGAYAREHGGG